MRGSPPKVISRFPLPFSSILDLVLPFEHSCNFFLRDRILNPTDRHIGLSASVHPAFVAFTKTRVSGLKTKRVVHLALGWRIRLEVSAVGDRARCVRAL